MNQQDIQNILVLIAKTPITGTEATTVSLLQQKLTAMLEPKVEAKEEPKAE